MRVDLVKLYLEEDWIGSPLPALPDPALHSGVRTAQNLGLRTTVHVDNDRHARMAIDASANGLEHIPPDLSEATIAMMVDKGITLTPTLAASEGMAKTIGGEQVSDPLVSRWVEPGILASLQSPDSWIARVRQSPEAADY